MSDATTGPIQVRETGIEIAPDPSRVITRFFVPGREDVGPGDSRAGPVVDRILHLDEDDVVATMADIDVRFADRHRNLHATFRDHAARVVPRLEPVTVLSDPRTLMLGASFTHEYAIEGAALCNPSAVVHPRQDVPGEVAFVLSVRGIGEGHISSIGFRTGRLKSDGTVTVDAPGPFPSVATGLPGRYRRSVVRSKLADLGDDYENAAFVLDPLSPVFDDADLDARLTLLSARAATRRHTAETIDNIRGIARSSYRVQFPVGGDLSEQVLWPHAPAERHGMEDARFVRFIDGLGDPVYHATYTAYDGINVTQQLLTTTDFVTFDASPLAGAAAVGKGLAIFPRRVGGRYAALSRADRETNAIAFSDDLHCWHTSVPLQIPIRPWEILQLGNCGSPIETDDGWLVLTHGVGPMRTYSLGVILLDLDEPQRVIARSAEPIMTPTTGRRDGYVPNVVYSCGAFAHGDVLVLPYGIADQTISIATLSIAEVLAGLRREC